ncbi:glutaredoxin family protein [Chitinimonas sp. BJYL2]|uniref:glutaredoxin family protein n=1 Tax=Chitinimonas sp. BJYL2 TaxID=2976696 RepID=UPI0022B37376|nr:glutaredoxin family protein [Chitinimonas sp. BJYL2]
MRSSVCLSLCLALLLPTSALAAKVYQWKDANGNVVFSDQPPPGQQTKPRDVKTNVIQTSGGTFSTREAIRKNPVILWSNNCGQNCDEARSLLAKRGVPYSLRNPQSSDAEADQLKKIAGDLIVPVLQVGDKVLKGFQDANWDSALDAAGYGKQADPTLKDAQPAAPKAGSQGAAASSTTKP